MVDLGECITVLVTSEQAAQNQAWSHSSDEALGGALPTTPTSNPLCIAVMLLLHCRNMLLLQFNDKACTTVA
jgi:hypothetical protein